MFDKSSHLFIYLTISMVTFIVVSSEYVGHPLNFTQKILNGGKNIYLDYDLRLINGSITALHFYALTLESDVEPDPFRLQVWLIQEDTQGFLIKMQLAFEKRIVVERAMLGRINKIPLSLSERFKVTPEHRLGLTNEGSHCIVGVDSQSLNHKTFVQGIPGEYHNIGDSVMFNKMPLPYRFSIGVEIEDADAVEATTIADSTTEPGEPSPGAVRGSSSSLMMNISSLFLCFSALRLAI